MKLTVQNLLGQNTIETKRLDIKITFIFHISVARGKSKDSNNHSLTC